MNLPSPSLLETIQWDEPIIPAGSLEPDTAQLARFRFGIVPTHMAPLGHLDWLARDSIDLAHTCIPKLAIPDDLADLIFLVISQENSCRYCYGSARAVLRINGHSAKEIRMLETRLLETQLQPGYRQALEYVRKLSRSNPRPESSDFERLVRSGFSQDQISEMALLAVITEANNRLTTLIAAPADTSHSLPDAWYAPLLLPFIRWVLNRRRRTRKPHERTIREAGPYAQLFATFDAIPAAHLLYGSIQRVWQSDGISPRAKALSWAVIGRCIGCPASVNEALRLLRELGAEDSLVTEVMDTLRSPKLSRQEAQVVAFARETVRYRSFGLQQKMRSFADEFEPAQTLEAIWTFCVGNAVSRLSVLGDHC